MNFLSDLWNGLPSFGDIQGFNLAEKLGVGVCALFLMVVALRIVYYIFRNTQKGVKIAIIHSFAIPLVLLLSSCSLPHYTADPALHPTLPAPVEPVDIDLKVDTIRGKAMVMMSWEDSQKLRIWLADIKRYTLESKVIMCYYRKELNEERCKPKEK